MPTRKTIDRYKAGAQARIDRAEEDAAKLRAKLEAAIEARRLAAAELAGWASMQASDEPPPEVSEPIEVAAPAPTIKES
jgi:hypothetical protein